MSTLAPLPSLPQISDPFYSNDSSNPASAFYVPPTGSIQNNAGQVVPAITPSSTFASPSVPSSPSTSTTSTPSDKPSSSSSSSGASFVGLLTGNLENIVFFFLGILLIGAGIFALKGTQQVISVAGRVASRASEIGAAAA